LGFGQIRDQGTTCYVNSQPLARLLELALDDYTFIPMMRI
jgi:hypothetical protein